MKTESAARNKAGRPTGAFTLIELLVTVSIIALLIGLLVPSFRSARQAAKNVKTSNYLKVITEGLESFRVDNEKQNTHTNGYPRSHRAEDPATQGEADIYGAHWLARSLVGKDLQGFIPRRAVPASMQDRSDPKNEQVRWYAPNPSDPTIARIPPYVSIDRTLLKTMEELPGTPPDSDTGFFPSASNDIWRNPLFVDAQGYPVLYYAANTFGKLISLRGAGETQQGKKGIYTHGDNEGFTGNPDMNRHGWRFKGTALAGRHPLEKFGPPTMGQFVKPDDFSGSWVDYIHNHEIEEMSPDPLRPIIKPHNAGSYLLITAGFDGLYGTQDDVANFNR